MTAEKLFAIVSEHYLEIKTGAGFPAVLVDENNRTFRALITINNFSNPSDIDEEAFDIAGSIIMWPLFVPQILYCLSVLGNITTGEKKTGTFKGSYWAQAQKSHGRISVSYEEDGLGLVNWPDVPITALADFKLGDRFRVNPIACQRRIFGGMGMNWLLEGLSKCVLVVIRRRIEDDLNPLQRPYAVRFGFIVDENDRDHPSDRDEIIIPAGEHEHWLHESDLWLSPDNCKPKSDKPIPMLVRV